MGKLLLLIIILLNLIILLDLVTRKILKITFWTNMDTFYCSMAMMYIQQQNCQCQIDFSYLTLLFSRVLTSRSNLETTLFLYESVTNVS